MRRPQPGLITLRACFPAGIGHVNRAVRRFPSPFPDACRDVPYLTGPGVNGRATMVVVLNGRVRVWGFQLRAAPEKQAKGGGDPDVLCSDGDFPSALLSQQHRGGGSDGQALQAGVPCPDCGHLSRIPGRGLPRQSPGRGEHPGAARLPLHRRAAPRGRPLRLRHPGEAGRLLRARGGGDGRESGGHLRRRFPGDRSRGRAAAGGVDSHRRRRGHEAHRPQLHRHSQ